jgi:hypothetical protein
MRGPHNRKSQSRLAGYGWPDKQILADVPKSVQD